MSPPVVAAIDCGTNSTRLLVSRGGTETLDRLMTITRLGEGVDQTGRLASGAIERTLDCLRRYREVMDRHGVEAVRITATSAARDAANRDELFDIAKAVVGTRPELLSGQDEGQLSFRGATTDLNPDLGPFLVVDLGGGSTELCVGTTACEAAMSLDVGCVRLTEKYLHSNPPKPEELHACISVTGAHLDDVDREMPAARQAQTLVGLAGTISTAAAVEQGLPAYDRDKIHHFELAKAAAEDVFRTLATESRADRAFNPGLEPGRVDVIVGGMAILVKIMRHFGFESCLVSESDILDGMVLSLLD
ncbi:exopolyphosphatase [Candidatus Poriferisocius sp.]|uniref:Ppx/GppA phosphatase family protein n=1 Tax=Candidatus Poriferisocius sp. TaxID=3101276 RepID=UPI003B01538F